MDMTHGKAAQPEALELTLARLLRIGAVLAAMLLAAGIALASMGMAPGLGPRLVTAGLLVLVSTPIIRVVVAMGVFVKTRDTAFAFFCLVVLALLSAGMLFGHTG